MNIKLHNLFVERMELLNISTKHKIHTVSHINNSIKLDMLDKLNYTIFKLATSLDLPSTTMMFNNTLNSLLLQHNLCLPRDINTINSIQELSTALKNVTLNSEFDHISMYNKYRDVTSNLYYFSTFIIDIKSFTNFIDLTNKISVDDYLEYGLHASLCNHLNIPTGARAVSSGTYHKYSHYISTNHYKDN